MNYLIEISDIAEKQIQRLKDRILKKNIISKIKQLEKNPTKGKHLFRNYYELKARNYRIYYAVYKGIIEVKGITFIGKVKIQKIGDKDSQKRDIKSLQ